LEFDREDFALHRPPFLQQQKQGIQEPNSAFIDQASNSARMLKLHVTDQRCISARLNAMDILWPRYRGTTNAGSVSNTGSRTAAHMSSPYIVDRMKLPVKRGDECSGANKQDLKWEAILRSAA